MRAYVILVNDGKGEWFPFDLPNTDAQDALEQCAHYNAVGGLRFAVDTVEVPRG